MDPKQPWDTGNIHYKKLLRDKSYGTEKFSIIDNRELICQGATFLNLPIH